MFIKLVYRNLQRISTCVSKSQNTLGLLVTTDTYFVTLSFTLSRVETQVTSEALDFHIFVSLTRHIHVNSISIYI